MTLDEVWERAQRSELGLKIRTDDVKAMSSALYRAKPKGVEFKIEHYEGEIRILRKTTKSV